MFVFRNFTIENLFPSGTTFSGYGDISFVPEKESELIWLYQVPVNFNTDKCAAEIKSNIDKLNLIISRLKPDQTLYICSLKDLFPVRSVDSDFQLRLAIESFNSNAAQICERYNNVKYIDIEEYFSQYPETEWINWKYYFISQMIVAPGVAKGFSSWIHNRLLQIKGARKKCIILDLDNTLWGGILGEDGIDGIKIGGEYPGNAFLYFQEALINLADNGVILTICSKNNEQDVIEAWEKNPFIKLNRKHISAYRINWNNKADNIRELASELNIGLDSMVFLDDNPAERELVMRELPMVIVPDFPKQPYGLMELYKKLVEDYFRIYQLTEEDKKKTEQYKANALRSSESAKFTNVEDFIKSLDIEIDVMQANSFNIPRIAQMTQKTNQFNLTTKRYSDAEISEFVNNGDYVYCISVRDKFGDNGITGAIIIKRQDNNLAEIDSLLLSCRILGKGIEDMFVKTIINILSGKGIKILRASYIPTAKNSQVKEFYEKMGFELEEVSEEYKKYKYLLPEYTPVNDLYKINLT